MQSSLKHISSIIQISGRMVFAFRDITDKSVLIDTPLYVYTKSNDNEARAKFINRRGSGLVKSSKDPHAFGVSSQGMESRRKS